MSMELDGSIALSLGWSELRPTHFSEVHDLMGKAPNGRIMLVPRWSSDLNAMWELEEGIALKEKMDYWMALEAMVIEDGELKPAEATILGTTHATAEQKARAFLAVRGEGNGNS